MDSKIYSKTKDILYKLTGITLSQNKTVMIDNRLQKMIKSIKFKGNFDELLQQVDNGNYTKEFINSFTTNKTSFFRESFHFDDLRQRILPELFQKQNDIKIYCSASSTGEEPYTIAMTILQTAKELNINDTRYSVISTDIDTEVLAKAKEGIYRFEPYRSEIPPWISLPRFFKRREIENSTQEFLIKAKDELKSIMTFSQMNLNDEKYPFSDNEFDVVFCRNVLIYFNIDDQNIILKKLFKTLKLHGTLYLGHSENPLDLYPYVKRVGHNIFIKIKEFV
jgi:chemotaxis protein methyltransferase CheR